MQQKQQVCELALKSVEAYNKVLILAYWELFSDRISDRNANFVQLLLDFACVLRDVLGNPIEETWLGEKVGNSQDTYFDYVRQILVNVVKRFLQIGIQDMSLSEVFLTYEGFITRGLKESLLEGDGSTGPYLRDVLLTYKNTLCCDEVLCRSTLNDCIRVRDALQKMQEFDDVIIHVGKAIENKKAILKTLKTKAFLENYNPRMSQSARPQIDTITNRICFFRGSGIKLFQFVDVNKSFMAADGFHETKPVVVMHCFLSLEADDNLDLSQWFHNNLPHYHRLKSVVDLSINSTQAIYSHPAVLGLCRSIFPLSHWPKSVSVFLQQFL